MLRQIKRMGWRSGPGFALGLFCGRIASEQWATITGRSVGLAGAVSVTLIITLLTSLLLRRRDPYQTWPTLLLLLYVFYPEPDPQIALVAAALAIVAWLLAVGSKRLPATCHLPPATCHLLLATFFLTLYITTLAPGVLPADNGEFQLIAAKSGVAHPPGFPLYTLLAHLVTRAPLPASPAYKVNLFSAVTSTLTLMLVYATVYRLTKRNLAATTAAIALGTSTTFWAQATTANIRSLTGLWAALAIYALVRFWQKNRDWGLEIGDWGKNPQYAIRNTQYAIRNTQYAIRNTQYADRYLILFALALSFGLTHHASLLFMGLVWGIFLLVVDPGLLKTPRRWGRPIVAGLLGLLPLLYLPWRAGADVRGASPGLVTWAGFLNHALALGFRGDFFYFIEPAVLWRRFQVMGNVMAFQFSPWLLLGMGIGLALMLWRDRKLALLLGGSFAIHTFITATYRAPQTVEYMLPAYVAAVICLGYGVGKIDRPALSVAEGVTAAIGTVLAAVMVAAAVGQGWQHYPSYAYLHRDTTARDYAQLLLAQAPAGSVILADWHWATPLWYLQEVEGQRPDVSVRFVFPTAEPYEETWARRIGEELGNGRAVIATHFHENAYAALPAPEPLGDAFLFPQEARTTLPADFVPFDLILGDAIQILGYRLQPNPVAIGQETTLTLAWQPITGYRLPITDSSQSPISLFAHLTGFDGRLYAQDDQQIQPQAEGITLTQLRLTPRLGALPGDFSLMVGAYIGNPEAALVDEQGERRTAMATLTVTPMSWRPFSRHPVYRPTSDGRRLVGYDWDNTLDGRAPRLYLHWQTAPGYVTEVLDAAAGQYPLLPWRGPWGIERGHTAIENSGGHYVPFGQGIVWTGPLLDGDVSLRPGEAVSLRQTFHANRPLLSDLATSVRLVGYEADGYHWAWADLDGEFGVPALGGIPTLKWIAGSTVFDPHQFVVGEAAYPGQTAGALLGLYDAFTNRPLPILDERFTRETAWRLTTIVP